MQVTSSLFISNSHQGIYIIREQDGSMQAGNTYCCSHALRLPLHDAQYVRAWLRSHSSGGASQGFWELWNASGGAVRCIRARQNEPLLVSGWPSVRTLIASMEHLGSLHNSEGFCLGQEYKCKGAEQLVLTITLSILSREHEGMKSTSMEIGHSLFIESASEPGTLPEDI